MSNNPTQFIENRINSFKPSLGEILAGGSKRNDAGVLVCKCILIPSLCFNARTLQQEIVHLRGQVLIATFVEGALTHDVKKAWLDKLVTLAQLRRILWH